MHKTTSVYRACRSATINRVRSLGKVRYIQPRKCVHSHRGGPKSWPPEPVWVTFLFQMKQIKKSCKSGNFFEKKELTKRRLCIQCLPQRCYHVKCFVQWHNQGRVGGGLSHPCPKWVGHTNCPNPMSSFIGSGGGAIIQLISIHVDLDTGLSRCE